MLRPYCALKARILYSTKVADRGCVKQKNLQNRAIRKLQTGHVTLAARRGGSKLPNPELQRILDLVNLLPPNKELEEKYPNLVTPSSFPGTEDASFWFNTLDGVRGKILTALNFLPERFRLHLLEYMSNPSEWERDEFLESLYPQGIPPETALAHAVTGRYNQILIWRRNLLKLAHGAFRISITALVRPDKKNKVYIEPEIDSDPFLKAIAGSDYGYIRECTVCGKFFYAARKNQSGCSEKCAVTHRKRVERENEKRRKEKATKKKRAQTSGTRSKRP